MMGDQEGEVVGEEIVVKWYVSRMDVRDGC